MTQPLELLMRRIAELVAQSDDQRLTALRHLNADPPDYSAAATACHRAYQLHLRADALAWAQVQIRLDSQP